MNYELAKELKDAGFPQRENQEGVTNYICCATGSEMHDRCSTCPYAPTLEELIEACGKDFHGLWNGGTEGRWDSWSADSWLDGQRNNEEYGTTPTEAVARLWLVLNNK